MVAAIVTTAMNAAGSGTHRVGVLTYAVGLTLALPVLGRRRWPLGVLITSGILLFTYYTVGNPEMSPSPVLAVPLYGAALAGRRWWAIGVSAFFFVSIIFNVGDKFPSSLLSVVSTSVPHIAFAAATILLGELMRSRHALAEETEARLRQAEVDKEREAARRLSEERVRIAREVHDTVAHGMATIGVQAGSALYKLEELYMLEEKRRAAAQYDVRPALMAIRDVSTRGLRELSATLGVLRDGNGARDHGSAGLERLQALLDAIRSAGVSVMLEEIGRPRPLAPAADHCAYRILQESLTNVVLHGGPEARVRVEYDPAQVSIEVINDADGSPTKRSGNGGHGLRGMRERAESVGGTLTAGPRPEGGFIVSARLPAVAG